jgi:hypothetical protein
MGVDSLVLRDPDLLRNMPDWSYSTKDQQVIGNAILHGYARKLAIYSLRTVPKLLQYRVEAGLDDYVMQNSMNAPLWLIILLDYDLSPLELAAGRRTSMLGTAYLTRRGPEFIAEYISYRDSINDEL